MEQEDGAEETLREEEEQVEDRISTLPDGVLCRILSLLPTKYSVPTSALSTRWKYLYTLVPVLDFQYIGDNYENIDIEEPICSDFVGFVTRALNSTIHKLSRVDRLIISYMQKPSDSSVVSTWVSAAIRANVRDLCIVVVLSEPGPTPHELFTCETLVSLRLEGNFVLSAPDSVRLPRLKKLNLGNLVFADGDSIRRLFSSCPVLEELLYHSWNMESAKVFEVSVPSLRSLTVLAVRGDYELLINAPNLRHLHCSSYAARGYPGNVLRSLVKAHIFSQLLEEQYKDGNICELLDKVCNVRHLCLAADTMKAIVHIPRILPTFNNLTSLDLQSNHAEGWKSLPRLLDSSPNLEILKFTWGFLDSKEEYNGIPFSPPRHVPICLTAHLKIIEFGSFLGDEDEYTLLEYFLSNCAVLEKVMIHPLLNGVEENDADPEEEGESDFERHFQISKTLLTIPRNSDACQVLLESWV